MTSYLAAARAGRIFLDLAAMTGAFLLAFLIRFDGNPPSDMVLRALFLCPFVVGIEYAVHRLVGVHRFSWRYFGLRDAAVVLAVVTGASGILVMIRVTVGQLRATDPSVERLLIPFGVIAINYVLSFLGLTGIRAARRMLAEKRESQRRGEGHKSDATATMLVGAGQAGALVARELAQRPDLGLRAVGFLDDDPGKRGSAVHGIPVLGATDQLAALCAERGAEQILITMANAPGKSIRRIARLAEEAGIAAKIVPGIYEIVGGDVNLSRIRDIAIEDLLRRAIVDLDTESIVESVRGKVVMVTGAAGSIGSELCRQLLRFHPRELVLIDQSESGLFFVERELSVLAAQLSGSGSGARTRLRACVADVTHRERCQAIFRSSRPSLVFHAAAYKHVPMMERDPCEAARNNILGTEVIADLAHRYAALGFVLVSTDKAVNPTSVMGATKRVAELYLQALSRRSETRFVTVRFGNVLGSVGSVVPIFREQIEKGGPVTVTHPEMERYFMTIPEAAQLVVQAGCMGAGGEIFILDMGEPVRIVDLARDLIRLYGLREEDDIEIQFTGTRPGEKLFEELSVHSEEMGSTAHPKIFVRRNDRDVPIDGLTAPLRKQLERAIDADDGERVRRLLKQVVPEYNSPEPSPPERPAARPAAKVFAVP